VEISPSNVGAKLERAADLEYLKRFGDAEAEYLAVLAVAPDNARAHVGLGTAARRRGDRCVALAHFQSGILAEPSNLSPRLEAAAELRDLGRLEEACEAFHQVLTMAPGNVRAHLGLGRCEKKRGDRTAALAHFTATTNADPGNYHAWLEIAALQRESGDFDTARQTALGVSQRHPDNVYAMLSIGQTERSARRHESALAAFQQARKASPEDAGILTEMAIEERWLGRQSKCDELLAQAVALDPRHVTAICHLADQATLRNDPEQAHALYQRAAREQPREIRFRLGVVAALLKLGKIDQALADLVALAAEFGPMPAILARQMSLLRQTGYNHAALRLGVEATAAHPDNAQLWEERLATELLVGSQADIAACLARMPSGTATEKAAVERFAGRFAESRWQLSQAAEHYEAAASIQPNNARAYSDLIRVKILTLAIDEAKQHLRTFCDLKAHETKLRQQSSNISQTHFGQIIDDYSLDHNLLDTVTGLQSLPLDRRIHALCDLARENPDNTAVAISLIVALRQSGTLSPKTSLVAASETVAYESKIPKTIVQFWDSEIIPDDVFALMRTWRSAHKDYKFLLFNDKSAKEYLAKRYPAAVLGAYNRSRQPAQKADIFRLAYLAAEGGIYADADDRCIAPIGTIIPEHAELVFYQEDLGTLANDFIAAKRHHPVLLRALRNAVIAILRGDSDILWLSTGPGLLTRAFAPWLADELTDASELPPGIAVLDRRELFRAVAIHCTAGYKRTDRHWTNTAFSRRQKPGGVG